MKSKITLLLVFVFTMIVNTQAQQGQQMRRTPEERAKIIAQRLTDSLKLSPEQQKSVETAYLQSNQTMDKIREGLPPGERPAKEDMDKINNSRDEKLKMTLTPAQFKRLKEEIEPSMRRARGDRPQGVKPAGN